MISAGWFSWAERVPGPAHKTNGGVNPVLGVVAHSAEGWEAYLRSYQQDQTRQASWHLSILRDGRMLQHYSTAAQCWASGAKYPNDNFIAIEHEGVAGQPLTDAQVASLSRVLNDLAAWKPTVWRRPVSAADKDATLLEHKECTRWGSAATACPSDRIPWPRVLAGLKGPEPQIGDIMYRWQGLANYAHFHQRQVPAGKVLDVWLRSDLKLPAYAKSALVVLYLIDGAADVLDGDGEKAGYSEKGVSHWRVFMDPTDKGLIGLKALTNVVVDKIECLGWWP